MSEPLLTRKSYREALAKERKHHEARMEEEPQDVFSASQEIEEGVSSTRRPKRTLLERYHHFLNVWLIVMAIAIVGIILIQIFL